MRGIAFGPVGISKSAAALLIALAAGALSAVSPPAALLALAVLAARALMQTQNLRVAWVGLIGPLFGCAIVGALVGPAAAIGMLFAWRIVADTHWSVEEARRLALAAGRPGETRLSSLAHAWLTPAYALAIVAYSSPHMVAGLPLDLPHVPVLVPLAVGFAAIATVFDWGLRRAADWRLGDLATAPATHLASHHALFVLAFGTQFDVSAGVVALIAWRLAHACKLPAQASLTAVP